MMTFEEARAALAAEIGVLPTERLAFPLANLRYSAEDVHAPHDHPLFDQSAVDGYAFAWDTDHDAWEIAGEVAAGAVLPQPLATGQCARIFTGGMMPQGADTVVMQERTTRTGTHMTHSDPRLRKGANVRLRGEQLRQGDVVLAAGERLAPAAVGLLRSVGVEDVVVRKQPRIGLVITGSEFAKGSRPATGHIFSSNGEMLVAALQQVGLDCTVMHAPDEADALRETLLKAIQQNDLVISTGGVSVGDLDLVRPTLEELGCRIVFHKVAQKPGKPMLLGRRDRTLVLGLPGNPRAVLVLFWMYVLPAVRAMQGATMPDPQSTTLPLEHPITLGGERAEFRAARMENGRVSLLADQGSHMLASLLHADGLAYLPMGTKTFAPGDPVRVFQLPR